MVGGNEYQYFQIAEPMKPVTTLQPMFRAAWAVYFISWMAQARVFSGLPLHSAGANASSRGSQRSPTHWPERWAPSANSWSPLSARTFFLASTYFGSVAAFFGSM